MAGRAFPGTWRQRDTVALDRLTQRKDYLAAKRGTRAHCAPFVLQARARGDSEPARVGITVTRKIGGAVVRNTIKRRLKSAIARGEGLGFRVGYDYVLIARPLAASVPFDTLTGALKKGLKSVHKAAPAKGSETRRAQLQSDRRAADRERRPPRSDM